MMNAAAYIPHRLYFPFIRTRRGSFIAVLLLVEPLMIKWLVNMLERLFRFFFALPLSPWQYK